MDKPDNDNGHRFHLTLNSVERQALRFLRFKSNTDMSLSAVIRACIQRTATDAGFDWLSHKAD